MIVVVADTSPLNYLIQIEHDTVLPLLYERVLVPSAVIDELRHPNGLETVRTWLTRLPSWLLVENVVESENAELARLDRGERQAIELARLAHADLLLMDERLGVRIARRQGLSVTGTLGVLLQAAWRGLIDVDKALAGLQNTDFRCSPRVFEEVRRRAKAAT